MLRPLHAPRWIILALPLSLAVAPLLSGCQSLRSRSGGPSTTTVKAPDIEPITVDHAAKPLRGATDPQPVTSWTYDMAPTGDLKPVRRLQVITYPAGSAGLSTEASGALGLLVEELQRNSAWHVLAVGFTDGRSESGSSNLGLQRAKAAANHLKGRGIEASRLHTQSLGSTYAETASTDAEVLKQERRVEIWAVRP